MLTASVITMAFTPMTYRFSMEESGYEDIPVNDSLDIAKGAKLAQNTCVHCHRGDDGRLSGRLYNKTEPQFGKIYASNITQSRTQGIGNWTREELELLLRTGVKPNGKTALPFMPRFPLMSSEDMEYLIDFLQSDNFLVQPSENALPQTELSLIGTLGKWLFPKKLLMPEMPVPSPDTTSEYEYGKYLVDAVLHCFACHSGSLPRINFQNPEMTPNYLLGGSKFKNLDGQKIEAPSIVTKQNTGINDYTLDDFKTLLQYGQKPDGTYVQYPMMPYPSLTEKEIAVIYIYLNTYKP
ncbi:c-type cytochrome [Bizionia paragorgiae]|uniref:c-type cytochrome n=1 Tax=Bizionia paragorgiae TaxID=283786 RepID=UPI003A9446BE